MTIERLQGHFGFTKMPFGKQLSPSALFRHRAHAEAVARIGWLISERGLGVVTGEVGAGKTVAARAALAALEQTRHTTIYLANPSIGVRGLYAQVVQALGGSPLFLMAAVIPQAAAALATEEDERGKRVVLVIDEAHLLSAEQLEAVRLLTNSEMDSKSSCCCLLLGQPTLRRRVKMGAFAAFDQRITLRYHLEGMDLAETHGYLQHHLKLAGRADPLFADSAVAMIQQTSRGIPRAVNNLAVQSLVATFAEGKAMVDEASARAAVAEVTSD